jgi:hypothetical protein
MLLEALLFKIYTEGGMAQNELQGQSVWSLPHCKKK